MSSFPVSYPQEEPKGVGQVLTASGGPWPKKQQGRGQEALPARALTASSAGDGFGWSSLRAAHWSP